MSNAPLSKLWLISAGLIALAHVWLLAVALFAGAWDHSISVTTVQVPYYSMLFAGICLALFSMKLWIFAQLKGLVRRSNNFSLRRKTDIGQ